MCKYHPYKKENGYLREAILIVYHKKCVHCNYKLSLKTMQIDHIIESLKHNKNMSNFIPELNSFNKYTKPELKDYILEQFKDYKTQNIAVQTPQLLLMLLKYQNSDIISIFN